MWLPNIGKTPKGKKPQERKLPNLCFWQRRQSSKTLERSERSREVAPKNVNSKGVPAKRKPQGPRVKPKGRRGCEEPIRSLASSGNSVDLANLKRAKPLSVTKAC
jgi:hypothetical protein